MKQFKIDIQNYLRGPCLYYICVWWAQSCVPQEWPHHQGHLPFRCLVCLPPWLAAYHWLDQCFPKVHSPREFSWGSSQDSPSSRPPQATKVSGPFSVVTAYWFCPGRLSFGHPLYTIQIFCGWWEAPGWNSNSLYMDLMMKLGLLGSSWKFCTLIV